jgi:hypothetical protein
MNIPAGSPWARAEKENQTAISKDWAIKSEDIRGNPARLVESVQLAVDSTSTIETFLG